MKITLLLTVFVLVLLSNALANDKGPDALLQSCNSDVQFKTAFNCDCLTAKLKEAYAADPAGSWEAAHFKLWLAGAKSCAQPESVRAQTLKNCVEKHYDFNAALDRTKVGKERFCRCVADETVNRIETASVERILLLSTDTNRAMLDCKTKFMAAEK